MKESKIIRHNGTAYGRSTLGFVVFVWAVLWVVGMAVAFMVEGVPGFLLTTAAVCYCVWQLGGYVAMYIALSKAEHEQ